MASEAVKPSDALCIPVIEDEKIRYESVMEFAQKHGVNHNTATRWCKKGVNPKLLRARYGIMTVRYVRDEHKREANLRHMEAVRAADAAAALRREQKPSTITVRLAGEAPREVKNQSEVARLTGMTRQAVSLLLNGSRRHSREFGIEDIYYTDPARAPNRGRDERVGVKDTAGVEHRYDSPVPVSERYGVSDATVKKWIRGESRELLRRKHGIADIYWLAERENKS